MTAQTKTRAMPRTYAERFIAALTDCLPDGFVATDSQGLIMVTHPDAGSGILSQWLPSTHDVDRRAPVTRDHVDAWLEVAERRLRGDLEHYTPTAHTDGCKLLSLLHPTPKTTRITMHGHNGYSYRVEADGPLDGPAVVRIQDGLNSGALKCSGRIGEMAWTAERLGLSAEVDPDHRGPMTPAQIAEAAALAVVKNHNQEHELGAERVPSGNLGLDALGWILGGPIEYEAGLVEFATAAIEIDRAQRA